MAELAPDFRPRLASKARLRWDAVEKKHMLVFPEAALMLNDRVGLDLLRPQKLRSACVVFAECVA